MAATTPIHKGAARRYGDDGVRSRRLWLVTRRALLMICTTIETEFGENGKYVLARGPGNGPCVYGIEMAARKVDIPHVNLQTDSCTLEPNSISITS